MIFEHDKTTGKITASLPGDTLAQVYECEPEVCMNPVCDCNEVFLDFERLGESHFMGFNIKDRSLIGRDNPSTLDDFANQVFEQMDESDFNTIKEIYVFHKKYGTEHDDYSQILVKFPKEDIEQNGDMVTYNEVLPYAKVFDITLEGTHYALEENYCVKNKCSCSELLLLFYPILKENTDDYTHSETGDLEFFVRVDYQSKSWTLDEDSPASTLDIASVQSAMESQYPEFYDVVKIRLQRMKLLYSNYQKSLPSEKIQKVGRNDPCKCGSGKKYKKCCGRLEA